jgi:hypothetical protein
MEDPIIEKTDKVMKEICGERCGAVELKCFAELLSPAARAVYETRRDHAEIELVDESVEGGERYRCPIVPFAKTIELAEGEEGAPVWMVQKLADVFSRLVEEGLLAHGVLAPVMQIRLADRPAVPQFIRRVLLVLYSYPTRKVLLDERDPWVVLNEAVGVDAFAPEGSIAHAGGWGVLK